MYINFELCTNVCVLISLSIVNIFKNSFGCYRAKSK